MIEECVDQAWVSMGQDEEKNFIGLKNNLLYIQISSQYCPILGPIIGPSEVAKLPKSNPIFHTSNKQVLLISYNFEKRKRGRHRMKLLEKYLTFFF